MPKIKEYGTSPVKDKPFVYFSENLMCDDCQMRDCPKYTECIKFFDRQVVNTKSLGKRAIQFARDIRPSTFGALLFLYPVKSNYDDEGWQSLIIPGVICVLSFSMAGLFIVIHRRRHVSS